MVGRLLCPCDKFVIIADVVRVIGIDDDVRVAAVVTVALAASIIGNNFSVGIFCNFISPSIIIGSLGDFYFICKKIFVMTFAFFS